VNLRNAIAALVAVAAAWLAGCANPRADSATVLEIGAPVPFAPGIVSSAFSDIRLTISPDGGTALWFSRDRPGGPGGYDIWISRRRGGVWSTAQPVEFNSTARDFDPAFSPDGKTVYFCSDRPGGPGSDDLYRVTVTPLGFGTPQLLGAGVNSAGNEWAPMLSADGTTLLFSSNGRGGAGRMDLFTAARQADDFAPAIPLPGVINTPADEFDATFLDTTADVIFSRARDLKVDDVTLFHAALSDGVYGAGTMLPNHINSGTSTYAPMLDWSQRGRLTFTGRQPGANSGAADVYVVRYRLK
jgi:TolB protein